MLRGSVSPAIRSSKERTMRRPVRLSSVRSLVSAVLVSLIFIFQSEDFSHFGGRIERLRPGPDAPRNVHRKRGILRVFEAASDHLAQGERFAAAGLRYRHVEPVLGVGHRSNRGRHVVLSIREWCFGQFGDRFDPSTPFDLSTPFDRLRDRAQDTAGSGTGLRAPQAQRAFLGRVETGPALPGSSCPSVLSISRPHRNSASANSAFNRSRTATVSASAASSRASSSAGSP